MDHNIGKFFDEDFLHLPLGHVSRMYGMSLDIGTGQVRLTYSITLFPFFSGLT